jgi:hypothetical protein
MSVTYTDIALELTDGIYAALGSTVTVNAVNYPVYVTMPKNAPDNYIYIGGVTQANDDTKDEFIYIGTVQIRVTTDNLMRAEKKLAQQILSVVRQILKPTVDAVFPLDTLELIGFAPESPSELSTQTDNNLVRVDLVDIYNFLIQ